MRRPGAGGYPAYRELVRRVSDVLAVLLAAASAVPSAYRTSAHPSPGLVVVLALTAAPLIVRRRWPIPVFGIILAACIGTAIWGGYRTIDGLALLFALYTVAALRPVREALACAGVLAVLIVGIAVAVGGSSWWYDAIFVCGLYGGGLGLGLYTGTRRAYLAELQDRAARLERERDQQGELAAAAERARIAREMHDIVAHNLTVMVTLSEAATAAAPTSPDRAAEAMRA
ncbi:MAG: histidine kinase, partial [Streptosporangiaceae bacterium]